VFEHQCQRDAAASSNTLYVHFSNILSSMQTFATIRLLMDSGIEDLIDICTVFQVQAGNYPDSQKLAAENNPNLLNSFQPLTTEVTVHVSFPKTEKCRTKSGKGHLKDGRSNNQQANQRHGILFLERGGSSLSRWQKDWRRLLRRDIRGHEPLEQSTSSDQICAQIT